MKQSFSSYKISGYLAGKMKTADEKKDKLLNAINRLTNLTYEKGSREGDAEIRQKVKDLATEIDQYYRMIRVFMSGKGGDADAFPDILAFFNERYLERNSVAIKLDLLKKEVEHQKRPDLEQSFTHSRDSHVRKTNIHAEDLERNLKDWEKIYAYNAEPQLRAFLSDINDMVLYLRIFDIIDQLVSGEDEFARGGENYQNFKNSMAYFIELHIKLTRTPFSEPELKEMASSTLQVMGFRNSILHTKNFNIEKYDEVLAEIIREANLMGFVEKYSVSTKVAVNAIKTIEKKQRSDSIDPKELVRIVEDLCCLGDSTEGEKAGAEGLVSGLAKNDKERYLFNSPGTFTASLKHISEYMRNSLILIVDWLIKELQKAPGSAKLLGSIQECIPTMKEFIKNYQLAIDVSSQKSNQSGGGVLSAEKHYISKSIAGNLIQSIKDNCTVLRRALIDSTHKLSGSPYDRSGVLVKKINIIKESCFESFNKINKGLSEIDKI
jgi:hypothetical protein